MKKLLSLLMATAILISASTAVPAFAESADKDIVRSELTFPEMGNEHYGSEKLFSSLGELENAVKQKDNKEKVLQLYWDIFKELDNIYTAQTINSIYYNKDLSNEEYAQENEYYAKATTQAIDRSFSTFKNALETRYGRALKKEMGRDLTNAIKEYSVLSDEDYEKINEEQDLIQQYERQSIKEYSAEIGGEVWTKEKLAEQQLTMDYEKYEEISRAIDKEKNSVLGDIFVQLVQLRDEQAEDQDYDNYADYAYDVVFGRDYTTDDIKNVHEAVKNNIVPLYNTLIENAIGSDFSSVQNISGYSGEEILDKIGEHMADIMPELKYSFDFMRGHKLYDIEHEEGKLNAGYTCYLSSYNVPFIYNSPYNSYHDFKDMVHEFGHFNNCFYKENHVLGMDETSLDVNEIQSQALELLFLKYSDEIYGEQAGDSVKYFSILDMLQAIIQGCCFDEFQQAVYENPDMSLEEINKCFKEINESYGGYYDDDIDEDYSWVRVSHTYQQPMYYISYATSGLSAFDIWTLSLQDRQKALDEYKEISLESYDMNYKDAIRQCGLKNIFKQKNIESIADDVAQYFEIDTEEFQANNNSDIALVIVCAVFVAIIVLIITRTICRRKTSKDTKNIEKEHSRL